jgi:Mg2+ and Co2+ transporter CorA
MTNKEEAILNIREALKKLMSFSGEKSAEDFGNKDQMKYEDMLLKDGSMVCIEEGKTLEVGVPIYKKDEAGNQTPLEDGSYELENGTTITVKDSMVESVSETNTNPQVEAGSTPATEAKMEEEPEVESKKDDMEDRLEALEEQISQILDMLKSMTNLQEETMSKVKEFAALPDAEPIKTGKKPVADVYTKARTTFNSNKSEIEELRTLMSKQSDAYGSFTVKQ